MQKFDVTAWETISKGGLLLGLDSAEIANFLHAYGLAYQANDLIVQLLDSTTGIKSALGNAKQTQQIYIATLQDTLKKLQTSLSELHDNTPQKS